MEDKIQLYMAAILRNSEWILLLKDRYGHSPSPEEVAYSIARLESELVKKMT